MIDIQAGDIVVCLDNSPRATSGPDNLKELAQIRVGALYRIASVEVSPRGKVAIRPCGVVFGVQPNGFRRGFRAERFRKVTKADQGFSTWMKSLKPTDKRRERIEARRAETPQSGSVHESRVRSTSPETSGQSSNPGSHNNG